VLVTQLLCASSLLALGLGAIAYGLRVLSGEGRRPWSLFARKTPVPPPPPKSRDIMLVVTLGFIVGTISLLGGLGLLLILLL